MYLSFDRISEQAHTGILSFLSEIIPSSWYSYLNQAPEGNNLHAFLPDERYAPVSLPLPVGFQLRQVVQTDTRLLLIGRDELLEVNLEPLMVELFE